MNKGAKKELLIDTFDVLKDMWPAKRDAIVKVLRSMSEIDLEMMMEMWEYLIKKNDKLARINDYESYHLLEGMVFDIFTPGGLVGYADRSFSLAAYQNKTINKYLFSVNPQLGEYTAALISQLILQLPTNDIQKILDEVSSRKVYENGLGEILTWIIQHLKYEDELNKKMKEFLFNYISVLSDRTERAVAYAAYLEID